MLSHTANRYSQQNKSGQGRGIIWDKCIYLCAQWFQIYFMTYAFFYCILCCFRYSLALRKAFYHQYITSCNTLFFFFFCMIFTLGVNLVISIVDIYIPPQTELLSLTASKLWFVSKTLRTVQNPVVVSRWSDTRLFVSTISKRLFFCSSLYQHSHSFCHPRCSSNTGASCFFRVCFWSQPYHPKVYIWVKGEHFWPKGHEGWFNVRWVSQQQCLCLHYNSQPPSEKPEEHA